MTVNNLALFEIGSTFRPNANPPRQSLIVWILDSALCLRGFRFLDGGTSIPFPIVRVIPDYLN